MLPPRLVCQPELHIVENRGFVELPDSVEVRFPIAGVEADLISYSRLLYRVERRDLAWKILSLTVIYERDTLTPAVPGTTLAVDSAQFSRFRPSYRCLAYHISLRGQPVPDDLPGDDQPDHKNALYDKMLLWLRFGVLTT